MSFEKVDTQVDFVEQERSVLKFWTDIRAFERLVEKNAGKPKWSFLDGPITANNPMGVHHAWGRTYKDVYQRYFAMTGHELRYQNGFDCQGLWVEVEVEKELKLQSKRDIENLVPGDTFAGIDKFVQMCKDRVDKFARKQTEQSIRLGYWMDWDREEDWKKPPGQRRSYFTMAEENNFTIWNFLKKCHERGFVYLGFDVMPWCSRCAVGLSQMEMHEGYQMMAHRSVFVKFPLRGRPGENLLIWTTTPWTLSSNVGAAVNPQLTYIRVKHRDEVYWFAKEALTTLRLEEEFKRKEWVEGVPKLKTLEQLFKEKGGFEILGELPGSQMVGWTYDGPYDELPAQHHPAGFPEEIAKIVLRRNWAPNRSSRELHRVIAWKAVGATEGTGIVHIAPGCGKEDFLLGKTEGLPPLAPLDDYGTFVAGYGPLSGKNAVDESTTDWILNDLQQKGRLFAVEKYPHSYPHCWRCKTELLFRLVDEWFINMSWRDEIKRVVEDVVFLPESINGKAREQEWLSNMGDWMISKKRFWGLALPIWVCEACETFEVMGSREELKSRAVAGWDRFEGHTPHRPWIDLVKIACKQCGASISRIPDVGNPWLDAGIVPYSTMGYNSDREYWKQWFPADFITECFPGQFRNWFYAILAMSTMMEQKAPFKVLLGHALVRDQWGEEMHKSAGNAIPFEGAADSGYSIAAHAPQAKGKAKGSKNKTESNLPLEAHLPMGADVMRWLYCRQNPVININFGPGPADEVRSKFVLKLWNTYAFFCNYARLDGFSFKDPEVPVRERTDLDRWILSDLQYLIRTAHTAFSAFDVQGFCLAAEKFVDDKLSNWYVRRNRRRFWKGEQGRDKQAAYQTLGTVLLTLTKLFAPVMPFLTEAMYQNLSGEKGTSVHWCDFPTVDESLIDTQLSADMNALLDLVTLGSAARNSVKIKVRQPLAEMKVQPADDSSRRAVERFADLIRDELNLKTATLHDVAQGSLLRRDVKPNIKTLGPKFGARLQEVTAAITATNPDDLAAKVSAGQAFELACPGGAVTLEPTDLIVSLSAPQGWAGSADRPGQVIVDTRITPELAREGMTREVIRHVNELRKTAGLEMEDRIILNLSTASDAVQSAINAHRDYIAAETLTGQWSSQPLPTDAPTAKVKVDGQELTAQLRKMG